jgi:hypothetical protein
VFSWLQKLFASRTAVEAGRENPVLRAVVKESAVIYDQIPLRDYITDETRAELGRQLFLEINEICNAADPVLACRDKLAATMLKFASYQVLVIPPPPEEDPSGLRGQPGISGQLKERLVQIVQKNDGLRSEMYAATDLRSYEAIWEVLQRSYWRSYWFLATYNAARIEMNDVEKDNDWYRSFMHAACANQEHLYRWELEMPPALAEDVARVASTAYSVFTDIVLSGEQNPVSEWRNCHKDFNIPTPTFDA